VFLKVDRDRGYLGSLYPVSCCLNTILLDINYNVNVIVFKPFYTYAEKWLKLVKIVYTE